MNIASITIVRGDLANPTKNNTVAYHTHTHTHQLPIEPIASSLCVQMQQIIVFITYAPFGTVWMGISFSPATVHV